MTKSLEDYLETIAILERREKTARVRDIADRLNVSKPSVHAALHELENKGLISHEHYGPVNLTVNGKSSAGKILKRHGVLKSFLTDVLGVSEVSAEKDACKMEHTISVETFEKLLSFVETFDRQASGVSKDGR
ncbi:MAG: metal-dependent transcriptional regulator [Spirochaetota bacterium]